MKLTKSRIDGFNYEGNGKSRDVRWDAATSGFGLRIYPSGRKSFVLSYRANGNKRLVTIGDFGTLTVEQARNHAIKLKAGILDGKDPAVERRRNNQAPTIKDLAKEYLEKHAIPRNRPNTVRNNRSMLEKHILPKLGTKKVLDVQRRDIEQLHHMLRDRPYRANRLVALLSKMFNIAIAWGWRADNPAKGIEKYHEEKRDRWLAPDELGRLLEVLEQHPNRRSANIVLMLIYTGARKSEVFRATWDQIDFERGVWVKPSSHTKQKKTEYVPLSPPVLGLLTQLRDMDPAGNLIFPGNRHDMPITEIKKFWKEVCELANIENVRTHDLRHTFASHLVSDGASLQIVGRLMGHTQASTTMRYAHLADHPLREVTNRFGEIAAGTRRTKSYENS